jgi:hypothetical protein
MLSQQRTMSINALWAAHFQQTLIVREYLLTYVIPLRLCDRMEMPLEPLTRSQRTDLESMRYSNKNVPWYIESYWIVAVPG